MKARAKLGSIRYEALLVCSACYSGSQKGFDNWIFLECSWFALPSFCPIFRYFRDFFQLAAHNDDQSSTWWHWLEGVSGPRTSSCLGPPTMLHSPRKLPEGPEIIPYSYLFRKNPQSRATLPHQIQILKCRRTTRIMCLICSKGRRVEYWTLWTFDTMGKGGEIRQAQISRLWLTPLPLLG
jgi:hypothetical protein